MIKKSILIYLIYFYLTEGTHAQGAGTGKNAGDVFIHNPTTEAAVISTVSPIQAYGNIDPAGQSNVMTNIPPTPEIISIFSNQRNSDDLARSARGALINGFENSGFPPLAGGAISIGTVPAGLVGLSGKPEGVLLGPTIGSPILSDLASPTEAITDINGLIKADGLVPGVGGNINLGLGIAMPGGQTANGLFNVAANTGNMPFTPSTIPNNALNAVLANTIASGPITYPVPGEFAQLGVANGMVNSVAMGAIANTLPNPSFVTGLTNNILNTPAIGGTLNGITTQGMFQNTSPNTFPTRNFAGSKSILASLTGIDPASFGTNAKFTVKSSSPFSPTGLTVQAENLLMQGKLAVTGKMPFLGSVTVDGVLPDGGKGTVVYECGNGNLEMVSEGTTASVPMGVNGFGNPALSSLTSVLNNAGVHRLGLRNNVF